MEIKTHSIGEAIELALYTLNQYGVVEDRENQDREDQCKEIRLGIEIVNPQSEPYISKAIPCGLDGLNKYIREFLVGEGDELDWTYTYHKLYSPFYEKVLEELRRNKNSRRACIALGQGSINFTAYPPCLQLLNFSCRGNLLDLTCYFRSNDGVKAFPMNVIAIAELQKKVAEDLNLEIGTLYYFANNFHAYSKDWKLLESYCKIFETGDYNRRFYSKADLKGELN